MQIAIIACSLLGMLYCLYYAVIAVAGNIKRLKPIPKSPAKARIAAIIPARNEASVIGKLVESLARQNYPRELMDIYVAVNGCTDDTEERARAEGAKILRCELPVNSKGEVLRFAFDKLLGAKDAYDAFVILDADNIVDPGFFRAANNALCAGYQIAQGYRDSKNPRDSWPAGCTSVFFWFMNRLYNHARASLGMSASLNGTGIVISADFIRKYGFETSTLTEDLELTAQCALRGVKIGWMEDAITYDEQPLSLRDSYTQRRRWSAGSMQCLKRYGAELIKKSFHSRACLDIGLIFNGMFAQLLGFIPAVLSLILLLTGHPLTAGVKGFCMRLPAGPLGAALFLGMTISCTFLVGIVFVLVICILENKLRGHRLKLCLPMGIYLLSWIPANLLALCTRPPRWTAIPHVKSMTLGDCEEEESAEGGTGSGKPASKPSERSMPG